LTIGLVDTDPVYGLRAVPVPATVPRIAPDDSVQMACLRAPLEHQAMILLGRLACLRLAEITSLHTEHREGDLLRVTGNGEKQRMVPIHEQLMVVRLKLEREQGPGFYLPGRTTGHLHSATVASKIRRWTGYNPHSLRHAGATVAYESSRDLRAVQMMLGHSSLLTMQRYLHVGMDAVRMAAAGTMLGRPVARPVFPPGIAQRREARRRRARGVGCVAAHGDAGHGGDSGQLAAAPLEALHRVDGPAGRGVDPRRERGRPIRAFVFRGGGVRVVGGPPGRVAAVNVAAVAAELLADGHRRGLGRERLRLNNAVRLSGASC
jgi:hypothetical protein